MTARSVETPGLEKLPIHVSDDWQVTYHRLFHVSPEDADRVEVKGEGVTVWDICFIQDLLQIINLSEGLLLDVGWYPHADPSGEFRLLVVLARDGELKSRRSPYDWDNPKVDFRTRSLDDLLAEIHKIVLFRPEPVRPSL